MFLFNYAYFLMRKKFRKKLNHLKFANLYKIYNCNFHLNLISDSNKSDGMSSFIRIQIIFRFLNFIQWSKKRKSSVFVNFMKICNLLYLKNNNIIE